MTQETDTSPPQATPPAPDGDAPDSTAPIAERLDCRGLELNLWRWPSDGPTLVLHHGFLDHARAFDPVARRLNERFEVLCIDARGHGDSQRIGQGGYYYFQDYVADLYDVIARFSPHAPVVLVGHSMGGMVTSLFAGSFPDRVAALVSIEGAGPPAASIDSGPERMREWIEGVRTMRTREPRTMESVAAAADRLRRTHPKLSPARAEELARHGTVAVGDRVAWKHDPLHRTRLPMPFLLDYTRAFWRNIRAPTLLVHGEHSGFAWSREEDREPIAGARRLEIAGAGHMMHHDHPVTLADGILDFLDGAL